MKIIKSIWGFIKNVISAIFVPVTAVAVAVVVVLFAPTMVTGMLTVEFILLCLLMLQVIKHIAYSL